MKPQESPENREKTEDSANRAAVGAAVSAETPLDPDVAKIVAAWPNLPEPIRRAMLALVG